MPLHPAPATAITTPVAATPVASTAPPAVTAAAPAAVSAMALRMTVEAAVPLMIVPLNCPREKPIGAELELSVDLSVSDERREPESWRGACVEFFVCPPG